MKKILVLVVLAVQFLYSQDYLQILNNANHYYQQKDFASAIKEYQKIINDGYIGSSIFYNLGNCYYRIGEIGEAILYYEKALKLNSNDEDIRHNLQFVNLKTIDKVEPLPKFFLFNWWESLLEIFTVNGWTIFNFIIYLLLIISLSFFILSKKISQRKVSLYSSLSLFIILLFCIVILISKYNIENNRKEGIVVENVVNVKTAPDFNSTDTFIIHEGLKVRIEDVVDKWYRIKLPDGKVGWIPQNTIGII